jgi:apolipoprotein N-acyltransferase
MELHHNNGTTSHYSKQVLLPFGEYIPFSNALPWLNKFFAHAPNYRTQKSKATIPLALTNNTIHLIPLICYEAVFTDIVKKGVTSGGDVMINTSNDGWFSALAAKNTHFSLALFRTIEFRIPLIRATNTGLTRIVSPTGTIISAPLSTDIPLLHLDEVSLIDYQTIYQQHPYVFKSLLIIFIIVGLFLKNFKIKGL